MAKIGMGHLDEDNSSILEVRLPFNVNFRFLVQIKTSKLDWRTSDASDNLEEAIEIAKMRVHMRNKKLVRVIEINIYELE